MAKRAVFDPEQNSALRTTLRKLVTERYQSHRAIAEDIGIAQQNVSRLLNDERSGFTYRTARAVALLAGHPGLDAFFSASGVAGEAEA